MVQHALTLDQAVAERRTRYQTWWIALIAVAVLALATFTAMSLTGGDDAPGAAIQARPPLCAPQIPC